MSLHIWRIINMFININKCSNQNKEFAWSLKTNLLIYSFNLMYVVLLLSNWACAVIRLTIIDCKAIKSYKLDFLIYVQAPGNISIYFSGACIGYWIQIEASLHTNLIRIRPMMTLPGVKLSVNLRGDTSQSSPPNYNTTGEFRLQL